MGFYLFRTPKPKRFDHVPIYYNESKERLDEMKRNAAFEAGKLPESEYVPNIKGRFRKNWHKTAADFSSTEKRKSNLRLVAIIFFLLFVAYLILNVDGSFFTLFFDN
jgi:hypothetical protein